MKNFDFSKIQDQMKMIPKGEIELRDDRINRKWIVEIESFLLSKFPITQDLYFEVTNENPSAFKGLKLPVETISWIDSVKFCNLLSNFAGLKVCYYFEKNENEIIFDSNADGYRLPSEAEWEYACKAGKKDATYGEIDAIAWYKLNSNGMPHEVGQKIPNEWGLYDLLGNVWEWCGDIYDESVYGMYRIIRGGGWNDTERGCLATNRRRSHPFSFKIDDLGFRIARNLNSTFLL